MVENSSYAFVASFPLDHARSNGAGGVENAIAKALSFWGERNLRIEVLLNDDKWHLDMEPSGQKYVFTDDSRKKLPFLEGLPCDLTVVVYAEVKAAK